MNIYVMDPQTLDRLSIVNDYSALTWNTVWGESGQFKIWAPITSENTEFLVYENLIWPDDQELVGVIEHIYKYTDSVGLPLMEVSGRFITESYLSRRIIWDTFLRTDTPASIIRRIIRINSINCSNTNRRFGPSIQTDITIESSVPSQSQISYCSSYKNLWDEVKNISLEHGLNMEFRYSVSGGNPSIAGFISAGQNKTSQVNLSTDLGFLTDSKYTLDSTDYYNVALIGGEGEGAERIKTQIIPQSATQRNRRELFVDARDLQKTSESSETPMTDEEYIAVLIQRGQANLMECPLYENYECSLQLSGEEGYVFGVDYNLGDIILLTDTTLNVGVEARVKEHQLSEDKEGRIDTLVFGISIPTITSLIKRRN